MQKTYFNFINEINSDELYEGLLAHGLFSEKLPPILTSEHFFKYCETLNKPFADDWRLYIYYESMRNTNIPRSLGIPHPMAYQKLCRCLADHWIELQTHFYKQTLGQDYKISRIHIRKLRKNKKLFSMNYANWRTDGTPEPDLLIGKRYLVNADISNCFPSIYSHAIPWALVGKKCAKENSKKSKEWYNKIDHYIRNCKSGETHGLLIGPHASNLLSEIILTVIDRHLYDKGWRYIRNIDDYSCYVESYETGQQFLIDLGEELRVFDLLLNHKKTEIRELPVASVKQWVRKINSISMMEKNGKLDFLSVRAYLDSAIELMRDNKMNSAILNYAIKVLSGKELTTNAKEYCIKTIFHLTLIFPYLVPLLEKNVFDKFGVSKELISNLSQKLYQLGLDKRNFESICYSIYFAIKYDFVINDIKTSDIIQSSSCMFKLFAYIYYKHNDNLAEIRILKKHANELSLNANDFDKNWLFLYEILTQNELKDDWKNLKKAGVSFVMLDSL